MTRPRATIIVVVATATLVVVGTIAASAQVDIAPLLPSTTSTTTAPPQAQPPPSATPTTQPSVLGTLVKPPPGGPTTTTAPGALKQAPSGATLLPGNPGGEGLAPPADAGPFPSHLAAMMNSVRRTRPNNSNALVDGLKALTDLGMPPEEAMRVGMGRFPVAGRANYSHDWWYPRFGPGWRLHQGTDVFGGRGTPLRSPTTGVVRFGDGGLGGISVYITQSDGTYFYLAHLNGRPENLRSGQTVNVGDIVGYLGSTGNASGGSPHLHFEVHPAVKIITVGKGKKKTTKAVSAPVRPGTVLPAIDPKPLLDLYLAEALGQLPAIVAAYQANRAAAPPPVAGAAVPVETAAIAGRHLAVGGFIAADAPLLRTPLLLLAFLLMVMVTALTPVLNPGRRLLPRPAGASASPRQRKRLSRRRGRARDVPAVTVVAKAVTAAASGGPAPPRVSWTRPWQRSAAANRAPSVTATAPADASPLAEAPIGDASANGPGGAGLSGNGTATNGVLPHPGRINGGYTNSLRTVNGGAAAANGRPAVNGGAPTSNGGATANGGVAFTLADPPAKRRRGLARLRRTGPATPGADDVRTPDRV